jgi:hypothetical protein
MVYAIDKFGRDSLLVFTCLFFSLDGNIAHIPTFVEGIVISATAASETCSLPTLKGQIVKLLIIMTSKIQYNTFFSIPYNIAEL